MSAGEAARLFAASALSVSVSLSVGVAQVNQCLITEDVVNMVE